LPGLSPEAVRLLEAHTWRGNVRELQQVMERAAILADGGNQILAEHLYFSATPGTRSREENSAERRPI
jgi:transcriptional regulator with PAS, ATPase and Fis domain